jgi:hypothetical protein
VHRFARCAVSCKHANCNLLESLTTKTLVKVLQAHLRSEPKDARQTCEGLLIALSLSPSEIGKILQPLGSLALLGNARRQCPILSTHRIVELRCSPVDTGHCDEC